MKVNCFVWVPASGLQESRNTFIGDKKLKLKDIKCETK